MTRGDRGRAHAPPVEGAEGPADRGDGDAVDAGGPLPQICRRHHLPLPHTQYRIGAKRNDFAWPPQRLVVETDSWLAHGTPYAFQADRAQSNALQLAGWTILRFTWADLTHRRRKVATTVRRALEGYPTVGAQRPATTTASSSPGHGGMVTPTADSGRSRERGTGTACRRESWGSRPA